MVLDLSGKERAIDSQKHIYDKIKFKSLHVLNSVNWSNLGIFNH